jgi:hypothetical protein
MLNGQLLLHGADIEAISRKVVKRSGLHLSFHKEEEYVAELIAHAWELSLGHDERLHPGKFARGLGRILPLRLIDIVRREEGRTRWRFSSPEVHRDFERPARYTLHLDGEGAGAGAGERGLGEAVEGIARDVADHRSPALARALRGGGGGTGGHDLQAGTGRKGRAGRGDTETGGMREAA